MKNEPTTGEVRKLPLWRHTLEQMRERGVDFGATFSRKWLEAHLSCAWGTAEFNLAIQDIRMTLEREGRYLSSRDQELGRYIILRPQENAVQGMRNQRLAVSLLRRTVTLLSNTPLEGLTAEEKRRHEATLNIAARRHALVSRTIPKQLS